MEYPATLMVRSAGGELLLRDGFRLCVPRDAVSAKTIIKVEKLAEIPSVRKVRSLSFIRRLLPEETVFSSPCELQIPFDAYSIRNYDRLFIYSGEDPGALETRCWTRLPRLLDERGRFRGAVIDRLTGSYFFVGESLVVYHRDLLMELMETSQF